MKKISQRKTGRVPTTKTTIDQEEVDAALQLIQLSGDSAGETPKPDNIASPLSDLGAKAVAEESFGNNTVNGGGGGGDGGGNYSSISSSVDDQISSTTIIATTMNDDVADNILDDDDDEEAFPSRKRKFRSLADLYLKTKPLFKGRQKKGKKKVELLINK